MLVFTYGTLMKGFWNHRVMEDAEGVFFGRGKIKNKDLFFAYEGGFPAVIDGDGEVYGEVYWIGDDKLKNGMTPLQILDGLEGYNPKRKSDSMYLRKRAKCYLENGQEVWVSYYYWNREVKPELKIKDGVYKR